MGKKAIITNMTAVDHATGQTVELQARRIKFPHPYGEAWFQQSQSAWAEVAADRQVTLVAYRVLVTLLSALDFKNFILVSQSSLSKTLDLDPSQVSRAMRLLVAKGWIYPGEKVGTMNSYRLNERFAFKGDPRDFRALEQERKNNMKRSIKEVDASTLKGSGDASET